MNVYQNQNFLFQMSIKLTHKLSCMAAHIHLRIAKSLYKNCKKVTLSNQILTTMPTGHTCVTAIIMETSFHDFSVIKKFKCYEKRRFEQEKLWKKHFATSAITLNWMPKVIILQLLFRDNATVNWTCSAKHASACVNFMHIGKSTFCFWYTFIFNVLY